MHALTLCLCAPSPGERQSRQKSPAGEEPQGLCRTAQGTSRATACLFSLIRTASKLQEKERMGGGTEGRREREKERKKEIKKIKESIIQNDSAKADKS